MREVAAQASPRLPGMQTGTAGRKRAESEDVMGVINELGAKELAPRLPWPARDANKYTRGRLVAVGGACSYPGAICMAACAALRTGAGYVEVVCAPETVSVARQAALDLVVRCWDGWSPAAATLDVPPDAHHPRACLVGSGMDAADAATDGLVYAILECCACPVIVDGGAIAALATEQGRALARQRHERGRVTIVTPHAGEAARMADSLCAGAPRDGGDAEMADFALRLADAYAATVALKGPDTFVADPGSGEVALMGFGTAALAKAGTGDVLAGMMGALAAQGLSAHDAATLAVALHATAARCAAEDLTEIGVRAPDVIACIPRAIRQWGAA